jgi:hypothetical protein
MKCLSKVLFYLLISFQAPEIFAEAQSTELSVGELVPDHLAYLYSINVPQAQEVQRQLYAEKRRWENGRTLRVCFYNGNPIVVALIRATAIEWNIYSGIALDFGQDGRWLNCLDPKAGFPEIRIGFSERGYWSYIGSDSERYGGDRAPSMNFDSFNRVYNEFKYSVGDVAVRADPYHKAAIRHEFGHALGLLHEHQNPALNCFKEIKWEGSGNVYEYFSGPQHFWSKELVDRNLGFIGATDSDYVAGVADPKSVMMYSLPSSIFTSGAASKCATPINYEISKKDKEVISKIYPRKIESRVDAATNVVKEDITAAYIKPAPQFIAGQDLSDYKTRIVVDLESEDVATRRNARARLSQLIQQASNPDDVDGLVIGMSVGSYRYKLGVAAALAKAGKTEVSEPAANVIKKQLSLESDPTLQSSLKKAQRNVNVRR